MALTGRYVNFDLTTGANDGTSEGTAWQTWAAFTGGYLPNQIIHFKKTAQRWTGDMLDFPTESGPDSPIYLRGYESEPFDTGRFEMYGRFALGNPVLEGAGVENFDVKESTASSVFEVNDGCFAVNCKVYNDQIGRCATVQDGNMYGCFLIQDSPTLFSEVVSLSHGSIVNCFIYQRGTDAALINNGGFREGIMYGNIIVANGNVGIQTTQNNQRDTHIINNIIYDASDAILYESIEQGNAYNFVIANNIIYSATNGITSNTANETYGMFLADNAMGNVTNRLSNVGSLRELDPITLTADPFVDAENGDFRLNNVEGGGKVLRDYSIEMDARSNIKVYPFRVFIDSNFGVPTTATFFR